MTEVQVLLMERSTLSQYI